MYILQFLVSACVLVAALLFLNAGVLYVLSPSNPGNISKAHRIFTNTLIGLIIILSAWLIVNVIMVTLFEGSDMSQIPFISGGGWEDIMDCGNRY